MQKKLNHVQTSSDMFRHVPTYLWGGGGGGGTLY